MPGGRSTFGKRQKEQARLQKQRDKAERKNLRKQEQSADAALDEMAELSKHAAAQAALFKLGADEPRLAHESKPDGGTEVEQ